MGRKQTEPWMPGQASAAHWVQGWALNVAAEPLQNEPLAGVLPRGNVSSPAMWNRFQLGATRAQSQCLETQLSVLCFFLVAWANVEDTDPHFKPPLCNRMYRRSIKDHPALVTLPSSILIPDARGLRDLPWFDHAVCKQHFCQRLFFKGNSAWCAKASGYWGYTIFVCN